jgi:hypothetical protein
MLRQATITSKTANAIAVANAAMIVANERTYITPYPNARNTIVPVDGKGPSHCGPGQVSRADRWTVRPLPLCETGRAERLLVALPRSRDLLLCAKDLFVEAKVASTEGDDWTKVVAGGSEEVVGEVRLRLSRQRRQGEANRGW